MTQFRFNKLAYLIVLNSIFASTSSAQEPFITTWESSFSADQIRIPTNETYVYNYNVSWKKLGEEVDEGSASNLTDDFVIVFNEEGIYEVAITGEFPHLFFSKPEALSSRDKLLTVSQWGDIVWRDMSNAFYECTNMNVTANDGPNLDGVTNMTRMFHKASSFNSHIGHWNTSNIESMTYLFEKASSFNGDIGNWDVSNVASMFGMFKEARSFNQDIGDWRVSEVVTMRTMFQEAFRFNQDISQWQVSSVRDMSDMFNRAFDFDHDLGSWEIQNVTDLSDMFEFCGLSNVNYDKILQGWADYDFIPSNLNLGARGISYCQADAAREVLLTEKNWTIQDNGVDCTQSITFISFPVKHEGDPDFEATATSSFDLPVTLTSSNEEVATIEENTVHIVGSGSTKIIANQPGDGTITAVEDAYVYLHVLPSGTEQRPFVTTWHSDGPGFKIRIPDPDKDIYDGNYYYNVVWKKQDELIIEGSIRDLSTGTDIVFEDEGIYEVYITGAFPNFTTVSSGSELHLLTVEQWGDIFWESMAYSFLDCENVVLQAVDQPDLRFVEDMQFMFFNASSFNTPIGDWNTSSVTNMSGMFGETSFNQDLSSWETGNVTDMSFMFFDAKSFNQDVSSWDIRNVTNAREMFSGASSFNQSLSKFDISKLTDVRGMIVGTAMSSGNYDETLLGWSTLDAQETQIPENLELIPGELKYCAGEAARNELINTYGWTITGDIRDCSQSIVFAELEDRTYGDPAFNLTATASSNLPITYAVPAENSIATVTEEGQLNIIGVGSTQITASQPGDVISYEAAEDVIVDLIVTPHDLSITAVDTIRSYGSENPSFNIIYDGFVYEDDENDLITPPIIMTDAAQESKVGDYPITVSGASSPNYIITHEDGTLTIEKATLTATTDNQVIQEGEAIPPLNVNYAGFVNNEDESALTKAPVATTEATAISSPDDYPITVSGGEADNYTFKYENGTLTIEKVLGLHEYDIHVYPNPANDFIYVESEKVIRIEIYDTKSALQLRSMNKNRIDLSNLISGIYFMHLKDDDDQLIETYRLVLIE